MSHADLDFRLSDAEWERARALLRQAGEDPDEVVARAAENLRRWEAEPPTLDGVDLYAIVAGEMDEV